MRFVLRLVRLVVVMALITAAIVGAVVLVAPQTHELVAAHISDHEKVSLNPLSQRSYMYDRFGHSMATLVADQNRVTVKLSQVSKPMIKTLIAVEDEHFYEHKGVNVKSIVRAFTANVNSGDVSQGGSTITQQLIKNSIVGNKQNLSRKLHEAFLAVQLEKQMTKDQILERYLNTVYFGNGAYGVEAAAELYFTVPASQLNWAQAALLVALIRSPNEYDPFTHRATAHLRRKVVLDVIAKQHLIPEQAVPLLNGVALPLFANRPKPPLDYFAEEVKQELLDDPRLGATPTARYNAVFGGGLRIYTTFDPYLQYQALQARDATLPGGKGDGTFDLPGGQLGTMAMVGVEPSTGAVRMLVGGPGLTESGKYSFASVDQATQSVGRQPGSSFKVFDLTEAMEQGNSPQDLIDGSSPCKIPGYPADNLPTNFGGERGGIESLDEQTVQSSNCAFLRLGQVVGLGKIATLAKSMGITTPLADNIPSMAIGSMEVRPLDMAAAYSVLANDGVRNPAYLIDRVTDANGHVIFEHQSQATRVVSSESARLVTQVLIHNVQHGTGTAAQLDNGQEAAGKTGTTNGPTDLWFVGYTPQLSVAVWMGGATGNPELGLGSSATGGKYPAATWGYLMNHWLANQATVPFPEPTPRPGGKCLHMPGTSSCGSSSSRPHVHHTPTSTGTGASGGGSGSGSTGTGNGGTETTSPPDGNVTPASVVGH